MKKILVGINSIGYGGVPKSLMNFMANMKNDVEIDLLLFREDGELHHLLPQDTNIVIPKGYMDVFVEKREQCKKLGFKKYLFRIMMSLWTKLFKNNNMFVNYAVKHSEVLDKEYDVAICFNGVMPPTNHWRGTAEYILKNVKAKKKFAITHDDYVPSYYNKTSVKTYSQFDEVLAVSKSCCDMIANNVPALKDKFDYCYNFCNVEEITSKTNTEIEPLEGNFKIVSATSLIPRKGIMKAVKAVERLNNEGFDITYYIIGNGGQSAEIEEYITTHKLQDKIKMLGFKTNPFAYAKNADLFILTSEREAAPMVYAESFVAGTPVLSTNTASAMELVSKYGYVCDISDEGVYEGIKNVDSSIPELKEKREKLQDYKYPNEEIKQKWLEKFNK